MAQWKHEYTEPPIDLRLLGSRPAAFDDRCVAKHMGGEICTTRCRDPRDCSAERANPETDWRHELSMAIRAFADSAHKIADALNGDKEKAAYIRANARQFGEPLPLQLVCSVWMVMEGLEAAE